MRKSHSFFIVFLLLLSSCSKNNTDKNVSLFNGISFHLKKSEKEERITPDINRKYKTLLVNHQDIEIPLFKYIKGEDYDIFIGLPYNTTLKRLYHSDSLRKNTPNIQYVLDSSYYLKNYERDSLKVQEAIISKGVKNSLFYIATISKNKNILNDSLDILNRFSN